MSAGDVHSLEGRIERAEDRADAAIVDVRGLARLQREFHRETMVRLDNLELRLDRIESTLAAQGRALNNYLKNFETKLDSALAKASGAHRLAAAADRRVSEIEGDLSFEASMAVAKSDGEELRRENAREWRRYSIQVLKAVGGGTTVIAVLTFVLSKC
jgi:hypothetical protein